MGPLILVFWMLSFKPTFSLSSFTFIKRLCSSSSLSTIRVVSSAYLRTCIQILKRQVRWSGILVSFSIFQFIVIHTVKGFGIVNKAEIDVFLELSCFFNDPVDVGNLIPGSSAFSKTSLNIWKFTVHVLLKPGLENFEHYFTSMWNECNCVVVWAFFGTFLYDLWNDFHQAERALWWTPNFRHHPGPPLPWM